MQVRCEKSKVYQFERIKLQSFKEPEIEKESANLRTEILSGHSLSSLERFEMPIVLSRLKPYSMEIDCCCS